MLKRLYIDNFRCFVNFEYKPERKQLLLGANGSGKSTVLDAIQAVKAFVGTGGGVFDSSERRLFQSSKTRWLDLPTQVFEIEAEIEGSLYVYRLENKVGGLGLSAVVAAESLRVNGVPLVEVVDGTATLYTEAGIPSGTRLGIGNGASSLPILRTNRKEIHAFVDWLIKRLFCVRINPHVMNALGQFDDLIHPLPDISDIAPWYFQIAGTDVEGVIRLNESLKNTLNGFSLLQFEGQQGGTAVLRGKFSTPTKEMSLALDELSEGQRCLIALYMVLHFLIAKGHTVFIDEPDNFISLREIQPWLLAAEDAVQESKGQLILISHHPEILNQWAHEYGVLLAREQNGQVAPVKKYKTDYDGAVQPSEVIARGWENE